MASRKNRMNVSMKHVQIDKANSVVVGAVAAAAFVLVFAGFAARSLIEIRNYQARVISQKLETRDDIKISLENAQQLQSTYNAFVAQPQNIIGGASDGAGERDGDNGRIVLDALPSSYDFPALITSVEKIMSNENVEIDSVVGVDEELLQQEIAEFTDEFTEVQVDATDGELSGSTSGALSGPVPILVSIGASGDYAAIISLANAFERSIRPFRTMAMTVSGSDDDMSVEISFTTYFQPEVLFQVRKEVVK